MTPFTLLCAILASFCFTNVLASPVRRDVYAPPITYPTNGTIWAVGQKWNVTWCVRSRMQSKHLRFLGMFQTHPKRLRMQKVPSCFGKEVCQHLVSLSHHL